jgi:hypothetical protein
MSARSYLLLEEASDEHDSKAQAGHALYAGRGGSASAGSGSGESGPKSGSGGGSGGGGSGRSKKSYRPRSKGSSSSSGGAVPPGASAGGSNSSQATMPSWSAGYNPWTGMVQAWSMPFRAPGADVLVPGLHSSPPQQ